MFGPQSKVEREVLQGEGDFILDQGVIEVLPLGIRVINASHFEFSLWTQTAKIVTEMPNGIPKTYFLKSASEDDLDARTMMEGDFASMWELYKVVPNFVPKPCAWGKSKLEKPATYFFLCDFVEMDKGLPDPEAFCSRVAELHQNSQSPTGMFGFPIRNCQGKFLQENGWDRSWASFFTRLLVSFFKLDIATNGTWPEYQRAFDKVVNHVIPKLLEPLQSNGRSLKPSLVHGDLWHGNAATNNETGNPVAFDASAFYAHNEYELGTWRRKTVKFDNTYFDQYRARVPPSEPVEQWDDRIRLYSLKFKLAHMIGWPVVGSVREEIYNDMLYLIEKYVPTAASKHDKKEE